MQQRDIVEEAIEDESDNETSGSEASEDDEYTLISYLNQPF